MSGGLVRPQHACGPRPARTTRRVCTGHTGDRFIGAQVPAENPELCIAERAPPAGS